MWEYSLRASGKILQNVFKRFNRVAAIAGKAEKLIFFWSLAGKARKRYSFFVDFPSATKCTSQLQWFSACYFLLAYGLSKKVVVPMKTKFVPLVFIDIMSNLRHFPSVTERKQVISFAKNYQVNHLT